MSVCDEFKTGHFVYQSSSSHLYSLNEGHALTKRTFRLTSVGLHSQFEVSLNLDFSFCRKPASCVDDSRL